MAPVQLTLQKNADGTLNFHPGDTIKGTVVMTLKKEKKCKALFVMFYGSANIYFYKWFERKTIEFEEIYLKNRIEIFWHKQAVKMQPGVYTYDISFTLPKELPRSKAVKFNCFPYPHLDDYNLIYYARANLDFPWSFMKTSTEFFKVERNDDLNEFPETKIPRIITSDHKFLTLDSIYSDNIPFRLVAFLPCTGFVPGQTINIKLRYENPTSVKIKKTEILLIETKVEEVRKRNLHRMETLAIVSEKIEGTDPREFKEIDCELKIPVDVNQSEILYSTAVNLRHALKITAKAAGIHSNPASINIPIIIGGVPLVVDNKKTANDINNESLAVYDGMKK